MSSTSLVSVRIRIQVGIFNNFCSPLYSSKSSFSGQDSDSSEESDSDSGDGDEVDSDENVD